MQIDNILHTLPTHTCNIYTILNTILIFSDKAKHEIDLDAILESWLNFIKHNIDIPYASRQHDMNDIFRALHILNDELSDKSFMVGGKMSIIDISLVCFIEQFENDMVEFDNLKRLYDYIIHQSFYIHAKALQQKLLSHGSVSI